MKKLLVMLLALCMVLSVVLVACEDPEQPVESGEETTTEPTTTEPAETDPVTTEPVTEPNTSETEPVTEPDTSETETETEKPADPVTTCLSFDELAMVLNGNATGFFTPGQSATWDGIANVEDYNVQYIKVWGWVGFFAEELGQFGYQIGDAEPVFGDFLFATEDAVVAAAAGSGAKSASRFQIMIPVEYVGSEGIVVKALARDAVGTVETLVEFTLNKAVNPNAPVAFIPAADMAATIPGSPGINGCTLSADGNYVTIDTIGQGDPYYQLPMLNGKGLVATHAVIKYRSTSTHTKSEMFVGSGGGPSGAGDNIQFDLTCDGKWNLMIVDLSAVSAVADGVVNYLRWDPFAGAADATIDMAYIGLFNSAEAAVAYDAQFKGVLIDTLNVPTSAWTVTGHREGVQDASDPMVAAGGVEAGALLHQGYIALGDINLAEMSKVVIYFGVDGSQVTIDAHAANAQNRIILTSADQAMTMSPTEDVVIAAADYTELGWAVHAIEIDLTGVDYAGPVFVTYDTLPGTFMLFSSVEFTYDPNYVAPEAPAEDPYYALQMVQAKTGETLYFTGEMAGEYLATSTDPAAAAKVYVETSENGLRQYVLVDGVKNYIEIHTNDAGKVRVCLTTEPQFYYVFDEEANTYVINFEDKNYYLGTYNDFTTIGCSSTYYITGDNAANVGVSQYVVEWVEYPTVEAPEEPVAPKIVDKTAAGMINEACDVIFVSGANYFTEGGVYDNLAANGNKITVKSGNTVEFAGWIGFNQPIDQFGYIINDGDFVGDDFDNPAEDAVIGFAGEHASRYHIVVATEGAPAGDYTVTWGVKLADGTIVKIHTVTVTVEAAE